MSMSRGLRPGGRALVLTKSPTVEENNGREVLVLSRRPDPCMCGKTTWMVRGASGPLHMTVFGIFRVSESQFPAGLPFHADELIPIDPDDDVRNEDAGQPVDRGVTA